MSRQAIDNLCTGFGRLDCRARSLLVATAPGIALGLSNYLQTLVVDPPEEWLLLIAGPFVFIGCFLASSVVIMAGNALLRHSLARGYSITSLFALQAGYFALTSVFVMAAVAFATTAFRSFDRFDTAFAVFFREILVTCLPIWAIVYLVCVLILHFINRPALPAAAREVEDRITIVADRKVHSLAASDIRFLQAQGNYVDIVCTHGRMTVRKSLASLQSDFPRDGFIRIHRSFVVNRTAVRQLHRSCTGRPEILLSDGTRLPVGRQRLRDVKASLGRNL